MEKGLKKLFREWSGRFFICILTDIMAFSTLFSHIFAFYSVSYKYKGTLTIFNFRDMLNITL